MPTKPRPQIRLSKELKKAVHSGGGWEDYATVCQFEAHKVAVLDKRLRIMRHALDDFYLDGGTVEGPPEEKTEDGVFRMALDGAVMEIVYAADGTVKGYTVSGMNGSGAVHRRMLSLFFCLHLIPVYENIIEATKEQLADIDNDNVLRGIAEIRELLREDRYLTAAAISGVDISTEDEDPFDLFGGGEE